MDKYMDSQREKIITRHYRVARYKNWIISLLPDFGKLNFFLIQFLSNIWSAISKL